MSAYAYCSDCHELTTGVMDLSKGFLLGAETNHIGCKVTYLDPAHLPQPIGHAIALLAVRPERITNNTITMLRLGLDLHDYPTGDTACRPAPSPAPVAAPTFTTTPVPALASVASTRSQPASTPTPATPARDADLFDLLGEAL